MHVELNQEDIEIDGVSEEVAREALYKASANFN